jgi:endoglucanase
MKRTGLIISLFALISISSQINIEAQKSSDFAFSQNERLGRGVNILSADPIWKDSSEARMTDKHFKLIKEAGLSNVRIVIKPFKFSIDESYTINPAFFTTLDWAINQALENELMVIVDLHEHHAMEQDPLGKKAMFLSMWKQIAEHCKDYPSDVLFEVANEPNMKPEIWNEIHKAAHQVMRESNPERTILIGPIYGNQIKYLKDLELPDDENIIVAIHYYMPIQFTHQGAPWSSKNKDFSGIKWTNSEVEEGEVNFDFDMAQDWSKNTIDL